MKKIILFLITAMSLSVVSAQEHDGGWTLRKCVEYAIDHNLTVKRAETTVDQSEIDVNTSKWARLPNLNGSAGQDFSWGRAASYEDNTFSNLRTANTGFRLNTNVPLFTGFQIPNQFALSKLNLKASIEDLNKAKDDLALNVASYYVQVLYNMELNSVAREQVELSKSQLARITRLLELGKASPAEVAETKARVAQDEMSAVQAENNYRLSLLDLSQLLELPTPEGFYLAEPDVEPTFEPLSMPDDIYLTAVSNKPSILAAQYRVEGGEKSIRIAQSGYYPQLSLGGGLSTSYYTTNGKAADNFFDQLNNNLNKYISFSLSIPIFNRFTTRNQVRTAKSRQLSLSIQFEESKKTLYKEIQQAWYNAVAAESKYNTSVSAVKANDESFRLMSEKYENGKATSIEFNESKLNLMKAVSDRIQAKYEYTFRTKVLDFYKGVPIE